MNVGIIGVGNIGKELFTKVLQYGWEVTFILKRDGVYRAFSEKIDTLENYRAHTKNVDIVFLAIPTTDDGKVAYEYISFFLEKNIPVVTCEKGAMSNYYSELVKYKEKIGYSSTVGGGSGILKFSEEKIGMETQGVDVVLNGTLNFIFDQVSSGYDINHVVLEAQKRGYTEPGSQNVLEVLNKEATSDIPMKVSIFFNVCNFSNQKIKAKNIKVQKISEKDLKKLIEEASIRRYVVSFSKIQDNETMIGGFIHKANGWMISGGFRYMEKKAEYKELKLSGVDNGVVIIGDNGTCKLVGSGAGAGPTTSLMVEDAFRLLNQK